MASSTENQRPAAERRVFNLTNCEVRASADADGAPVFSGYAAVFNELSVNLGGFRERIQPGCFRNAVDEGQDVRFLINHDSNLILGRTTAGTVTLTEDEVGLRVECPLPNISYARDLAVSMERGDINQMSFGFFTVADEWNETDPESGLPIRELLRANLFDVSAVTYPAYPDTTAAVASVRSWIEEKNPELLARAALAATELATSVEVRVGKTLSKANAEAIANATELLQNVLATAAENGATDELDTVQHPAGENDATPAGEQRDGEMCAACGALQMSEDASYCSSCGAAMNSAEPAGEERVEPEVVEPVIADVDETEVEDVVRPDFTAFRAAIAAAVETRTWDYDDDWSVYCLTQMIEIASMFLLYSDDGDSDDAPLQAGMGGILSMLTGLLQTVVTEATAPAEGVASAEVVEDTAAADEVIRTDMLRRRLALRERELEIVV